MSAILERGSGSDPAPAGAPGARPQPRREQERTLKFVAAIAAVALVGFIVFVVVHTETVSSKSTFPQTRPSSLRAGATAPSFTLPRLGGGQRVSLATGDGKPVLLDFFASWCSDCRAELRAVATVARKLDGRVTVIGVDTSDPATSTAERLLASAGASYPVGVDPGAHVAAQYRITGLPVLYFVNADDRVVGVAFGPQHEKSLLRRATDLSAAS